MYIGEFFKLGNEGDFKYFTLPHFIPLIIMFLVIFLLYKYKDVLRNYPKEKKHSIGFSLCDDHRRHVLFLAKNVYWI